MSKYSMEDGTIVDTEKATAEYEEKRDWDGHNHIGRSSGSQWDYQTLYRSRKGRYYMESTGRNSGGAEFVESQEAARFLILNDHELPDELKEHMESLTE